MGPLRETERKSVAYSQRGMVLFTPVKSNNNRRVIFLVPAKLRADISKAALREDLSVAQFVRRALRNEMNRRKECRK